MRITVLFDDEMRMRATMTIAPSWIGALFGRRPRVAQIQLDGTMWRYKFDRYYIGADMEKIVNDQRRWQHVGDLPIARAVPDEDQRFR